MSTLLDTAAIEPLLALADGGHPAPVGLAALEAATRFPLSAQAWTPVAQATARMINTEAFGSDTRHAALALAVRVPLRSLREHLRQKADDPDEPDRHVLNQALVQARDASRIDWLLNESALSAEERVEALATLPIEQSLALADLPRLPPEAPARAWLWLALAHARLGHTEPLDALLSGDADDLNNIDLFSGSPWVAYDAIARVRPLPSRLRTHLLKRLHHLDKQTDDEGSTQRHLRQLIVWAATGVRDAEGRPLPEPQATRTPPTSDVPLRHAPERILTILAEGNQRAATAPPEAFTSIDLGNDMVEQIMHCPIDGPEPVARYLQTQMAAPRPAMDDGQLAWVLARDESPHLIHELSQLAQAQATPARQAYVLRMLALAADCQSGRSGSPMRGAGPTGGDAEVPALIDDLPRQMARAKPPEAPREQPPEAMGTLRMATVAAPAPSTREAPAEERCVHARILQGQQMRQSFVAGAEHTIRCWIGLPEAQAAHTSQAIPAVHLPPTGLVLTAQLCWCDGNGVNHQDSQTLLLPAGRDARSGDCDLRLGVPADETHVCVDIVFLYAGRVFEAVRLEAEVLAPGQAESATQAIRMRVQAQRRQVIEIPDSQPVDTVFMGEPPAAAPAVLAPGATLLTFGQGGGQNLNLDEAHTAIAWLNTALHNTQTLMVRKQMAAGTTDAVFDTTDTDARDLLLAMARHGTLLYHQLSSQGLGDPGQRIQIISDGAQHQVPLEFVYDGGYPADQATLCADGFQALSSGEDRCPHCQFPGVEDDRGSVARICPYGFWSLRKVIERVSASGPGSTPTAHRRQLPPMDAVAFASSNLVPDDERQATLAALQARFPTVLSASDWVQWRQAVKAHPALLVVLPHHGIQGMLDYLEIGEQTLPSDLGKLSAAQITPQVINPGGHEPGPVVLLLGCQTATDTSTGYGDIARLVQQQQASIVLGTLAQVLGRHAGPLAREFALMLSDVAEPATDFGTVMLRIRRRMLSRGCLIAMCLIALGDAEWQLQPRHAA